jgi:outer membrane protein assembly factor BamB
VFARLLADTAMAGMDDEGGYETLPKLEWSGPGPLVRLPVMQDRFYVGVKRYVLCLERRTGREIWRTELKNSILVNLVVNGDMILAHAGGVMFGLRAADGAILWRNEFTGLGYGYCLIATDTSQSIPAAVQHIQLGAVVAASSAAAAG